MNLWKASSPWILVGAILTAAAAGARLSTYGLSLFASGPLVDNNTITGGCGATDSAGVLAQDAWARLQNNRITGDTCQGHPTPTTYGMRVIVDPGTGTAEMDVHSNDLDGGRTSGFCTSAGLALDIGATTPGHGVGMYRNNIIRAGVCSTRYNVLEQNVGADPRVFLNNDLDPNPLIFGNPPTALYRNENSSALTTAAAVNALVDMMVAGVISADALYTSYPTDFHLLAGSACINAGTPAGAPAKDMDGQPRDDAPDIGADER